MTTPPDAAEQKVLKHYAKLYPVLMQLVESLQHLEPVGTFVDEAEFKKVGNNMRVQYKARPVRLTIEDGRRKFTLRIEETN